MVSNLVGSAEALLQRYVDLGFQQRFGRCDGVEAGELCHESGEPPPPTWIRVCQFDVVELRQGEGCHSKRYRGMGQVEHIAQCRGLGLRAETGPR